MKLEGRRIVVVGMQRSGVASAELLLELGAIVTLSDREPAQQLGEAVQALVARGLPFLPQGGIPAHHFDAAVLSPGVPANSPDLASVGTVMGEVELAAPLLRGRTIGITGSNGKTTTTALTGHILDACGLPAQVGGNIGTPVCAMVATSRAGQWNVLELSSFQLETTHTLHVHTAVILNVTQNHLDRHYTMERYAEAKARILDAQTGADDAILNADDSYCRQFASRGSGQRTWFSSTGEADIHIRDGHIYFQGKQVMPVADVPIKGAHNLENTMAAMAVANTAGAPLGTIADAVRTFRAVEHRLEFVANIGGVDYYNDSKATSVDATLKALSAFPDDVWLILGGKDKGSNYSPLRAPASAKVRAALLIGAAAEIIARDLEGSTEIISIGTLDAALVYAFTHAQPGDTVLLAPACSSFDQFESFEHRGRHFKELVHAISRETHGTAA